MTYHGSEHKGCTRGPFITAIVFLICARRDKVNNSLEIEPHNYQTFC